MPQEANMSLYSPLPYMNTKEQYSKDNRGIIPTPQNWLQSEAHWHGRENKDGTLVFGKSFKKHLWLWIQGSPCSFTFPGHNPVKEALIKKLKVAETGHGNVGVGFWRRQQALKVWTKSLALKCTPVPTWTSHCKGPDQTKALILLVPNVGRS